LNIFQNNGKIYTTNARIKGKNISKTKAISAAIQFYDILKIEAPKYA